jgi:hypothetical protein
VSRFLAALGWIFVLSLNSASLRAQNVGDFYRGKTVTISLGTEPGNSYDIYTRTLARHLSHPLGNRTRSQIRPLTNARDDPRDSALHAETDADGSARTSKGETW